MLRAIREIQPGWIVGENVPGIINWSGGLVFHEVQTDLEAEGYEVFPVILPACGVNAPHKRERVWFVAYNNGIIWRKRGQCESREQSRYRESTEEKTDRTVAHSVGKRKLRTNVTDKSERMESIQIRDISNRGITPYTPGNAVTGQNREGIEVEGARETINEQIGGGQLKTIQLERLDDILWSTPNTNGNGERLLCRSKSEQGPETHSFNSNTCGYGATSNSDSRRQSSKEHRQEKPGLTTEKSGTNNWKIFPTQPPLCSRDDGFSSRLDGITFPKWRNESIKGYGNAIVPELVLQIFEAIEETNIKLK